jgi:hypothetical protein
MSIRPDDRAQLRDLLRATLTSNDGTVPTAVRRSACEAFSISTRQLCREIAAVRSQANAADTGNEPATAAGGRDGAGWWTRTPTTEHVLTVVAATDTMKQAWTRLHRDGTSP